MPGCRTSASWLDLRRDSEVHMHPDFHASATMFVFLRGHHLLEYYFSVSDSRSAANDRGITPP
jgi:hypothetical protein